jgi:hypothetical protein
VEILGKKNKEIEENHWTGERDLDNLIMENKLSE